MHKDASGLLCTNSQTLRYLVICHAIDAQFYSVTLHYIRDLRALALQY